MENTKNDAVSDDTTETKTPQTEVTLNASKKEPLEDTGLTGTIITEDKSNTKVDKEPEEQDPRCKCTPEDPEHLLDALRKGELDNSPTNNSINGSGINSSTTDNNTGTSTTEGGSQGSSSSSASNAISTAVKKALPPNFVVPPIGTTGIFYFLEPFDTILKDGEEYEVKALRLLSEMRDNQEKPYENVYQSVGMSDTDFMVDLSYNVPIAVLVNSLGEYYYVPCTKLKQTPRVTGVRYQEKILAINLGFLPQTYDFSLLLNTIQEDVYTVSGVVSTIQIIPSSSTMIVPEEESKVFLNKLENKKTVKQSYRTRYEKITKENAKLKKQMSLMNVCIKHHLNNRKEIQA